MHRRSFWEAHAGNARIPVWQRIYALAYGVHRRNGHAPFMAGEIATAVAINDIDTSTGEVLRTRVPTSADISHAIATAVENGFLDPKSNSACLVVPRHAIEGGLLGKESEVCKQRHRSVGDSSQQKP